MAPTPPGTAGGLAVPGAPSSPAPTAPPNPPPATTIEPAATFRPVVCLTKREVFDACQALADADRVLVAAGTTDEAGALADLFELLEDRMTRA
jgi:hypothetical protein